MPTAIKTDPPRRPSAPRSLLLAVGAALLLVLTFVLSGRSAPVVFTALIIDGSLLALWLLAAAGYGALIPIPPSPLRPITKIALGLGVISTLQLLLGLAGLLHRPIAFAIIAIGIASFLYHHRKATSDSIRHWLAEQAKTEWLWLIAIPILAMAITAAYAPPGILWGDEPHGYDVLEYHLQLPREWLELGRITPLHHNAFSYFPLAVEMHYLLAMQLEGGPWAGMYLAQLMHVAMIALTIIAIYAAVKRAAPSSTLAPILAALSAAAVPWLLLLAPVAYNEGGLLLFGTLAIAWILAAEDRKHWLIAGLCAGFACGTKLTAVPQILILLPLVAWLTFRAKPINVAVYIFAGTLAFSPWLIRNLIWTGNPVFPEAQSVFGRAHFSPQQQERWHRAHSPTPAEKSLNGRFNALRYQLGDWRFGFIFFLVCLFGFIAERYVRRNYFLLVLWFGCLLFWVTMSHLQGRFFVISIPIAALGIANLDWRRRNLEAVVVFLVGVQIILGIVLSFISFQRLSNFTAGGALVFQDLSQLLSEEAGAAVDNNESINLIGDARAFLYPAPMSKLHYKTVFDVDVKPGQKIVDAWAEGMPPDARRIIDRNELDRFSKTYYGITKPD